MQNSPWNNVMEEFRTRHVAFHITSRSTEEAAARLRGQLSPHNIRLIGASDRFSARFLAANELAGFQLSALAYGTEVELEISTADDHLLVTAQTDGYSFISSQGMQAQGGSGFIVIDSTPEPVIKRFSADSARINLRVPRARLHKTLENLTGKMVTTPLIFHPFLGDQLMRERWHSHLRLLMGYGLHNQVVPTQQAEALSENVLLSMLLEFPHNHSKLLQVPASSAGSRAFVEACNYIHAHLSEPLRLENIARHCNISIRSLSATFTREHGMSVMCYVTEARLLAARQRLLRAAPKTKVSCVASDCGFSGLGRFSASYRTRFGELPSETLARR